MKVTVSQEDLASAASYAATGGEKGENSIAVVVGAETVTFRAGGAGHTVHSATILASAVEEGPAVAVPAKLLAAVAHTLPDGDVVLSYTDGDAKLAVVAGSIKIALPTVDLPPEAPTPAAGAVEFEINAAKFVSAVALAAKCAAPESNVSNFSGIRIEVSDGQAVLVSTDRYRLIMEPVTVADEAAAATLTTAASGLEAAVKTMAADGETIKVTVAANMLRLATPHREAILGLLAAEYPNWKALLTGTKANKVGATVDADTLAAALGRAKALRSGDDVGVAVKLNTDIGIELSYAGGSDYDEIVAAEMGEDVDVIFGVNPKFFLDGLGAFKGQKVQIATAGESRAVTLRNIDEADKRVYLLMPIKLHNK